MKIDLVLYLSAHEDIKKINLLAHLYSLFSSLCFRFEFSKIFSVQPKITAFSSSPVNQSLKSYRELFQHFPKTRSTFLLA